MKEIITLTQVNIASVFICFVLSSSSFGSDVVTLFNELRSDALKNASGSKASRENIKLGKARWYSGVAGNLPRVDLTLSQQRVKDQVGVPPSNLLNDQSRSESTWSVNINIPIYNRDNQLDYKEGKVARDRAVLDDNLFQRQVNFQVKALLGQIINQRYKLTKITESIALFEQLLIKSEQGKRLGNKLASDVEQIRANLLLLKSRKEVEKQALVSVVRQLLNITQSHEKYEDIFFVRKRVGNSLDENRALFTKELNLKLDKYNKVQDVSKIIVKDNLQRKIIDSQYDSEEVRADRAIASEHPTVDFRANYEKIGPEWSDTTSFDNKNETIGVYLNVPIFTSGTSFSRSREKSSIKSIARYRKDESLKRLGYDTWDLIQRSKIESMKVEQLRKYVVARKKVVDLYKEGHKLGRISIDDLITQQNSYVDSLISLGDSELSRGILNSQIMFNLSRKK